MSKWRPWILLRRAVALVAVFHQHQADAVFEECHPVSFHRRCRGHVATDHADQEQAKNLECSESGPHSAHRDFTQNERTYPIRFGTGHEGILTGGDRLNQAGNNVIRDSSRCDAQLGKWRGEQGSWCLKAFSKDDRKELSRHLLSPALSSAWGGGEGARRAGEEALIGEAIVYHLERV